MTYVIKYFVYRILAALGGRLSVAGDATFGPRRAVPGLWPGSFWYFLPLDMAWNAS